MTDPFNWLHEWGQVLAGFGSLILTFFLVRLYQRQTDLLEDQQDLLTHELNREMREQHTETLRERVEAWHGNPTRESPDEPFGSQDRNLPRVHGASIKSAEHTEGGVFPRHGAFSVIPPHLHGDRYLEDLLENHAPDLRELKKQIKELQNQYQTLQNEFSEAYDVDLTISGEDYDFTTTEHFSNWLFKQIVLTERGRRDSLQDALDTACLRVTDANKNIHEDDRVILIMPSDRGGKAIFKIHYQDLDPESIYERYDEFDADIEDALEEAFAHIDSGEPYDKPRRAANTLDQAQEAIEKLDQTLIEYVGRPVYPGDCKYLDEASV